MFGIIGHSSGSPFITFNGDLKRPRNPSIRDATQKHFTKFMLYEEAQLALVQESRIDLTPSHG